MDASRLMAKTQKATVTAVDDDEENEDPLSLPNLTEVPRLIAEMRKTPLLPDTNIEEHMERLCSSNIEDDTEMRNSTVIFVTNIEESTEPLSTSKTEEDTEPISKPNLRDLPSFKTYIQKPQAETDKNEEQPTTPLSIFNLRKEAAGSSKKTDSKAGNKCSLPHCRRSKRKYPGTKLFRFPKINTPLFKQWIEKCNFDREFLEKRSLLFLCDRHFPSGDIGSKYLNRGAIPTLHLTSDSNDTTNIPDDENSLVNDDIDLTRETTPPGKRKRVDTNIANTVDITLKPCSNDTTIIQNIENRLDNNDLDLTIHRSSPPQRTRIDENIDITLQPNSSHNINVEMNLNNLETTIKLEENDSIDDLLFEEFQKIDNPQPDPQITQHLKQNLQSSATNPTNEVNYGGDTDYNFLISLLPDIKKMSELQKNIFRYRISNMISNILASAAIPSAQQQHN